MKKRNGSEYSFYCLARCQEFCLWFPLVVVQQQVMSEMISASDLYLKFDDLCIYLPDMTFAVGWALKTSSNQLIASLPL